MGDLILSFPLFLWLRRMHPDRPIWVVAEETFFRPLMGISPDVVYIPWEGTDRLLKQSYKMIVNLSIRKRAAELAGKLNSDKVVGPMVTNAGSRYVHGKWQLYRSSLVDNNRYNRFHWADLNALDLIPAENMAATRFDPPRSPEGNRVGIFLGASEEAKHPSAEFWIDLVRELQDRGLRPAIFGGPAERRLGKTVFRACDTKPPYFCDKMDLDELTVSGQALSLFITPDTGPMHLMSWSGCRTLNLSMGNVNPWETSPYQPGHFVLRPDLDCARGCWKCTQGRLHCHDLFDAGRVAFLIAQICRGATRDKLSRLDMPGLNLFLTSRSEHGLHHMELISGKTDSAHEAVSRFWTAWFSSRLGFDTDAQMKKAITDLAENGPLAMKSIFSSLPGLGRCLSRGISGKQDLGPDFWDSFPNEIRPFTGYIHMYLQNNDFTPEAWTRTLSMLEGLVTLKP